jgi:hypothetical protein
MQPGQPGQQGGQQGGGQGGGGNFDGGPGGVRDGFGGNWGGNYGGYWGGNWNPRTTPFTDEEIRQYQREFAQRLSEANDLRQELQDRGQPVEDLDRAIAAFRELQAREAYENLPQVALLQQQLRESLRQVEFGLRREVEGEAGDRVFTAGSDAVPTGFRTLVEEYYRRLASGRPQPPPQR